MHFMFEASNVFPFSTVYEAERERETGRERERERAELSRQEN